MFAVYDPQRGYIASLELRFGAAGPGRRQHALWLPDLQDAKRWKRRGTAERIAAEQGGQVVPVNDLVVEDRDGQHNA